MTDNIISKCDDIQLACWYTGAATGPIGLSRFRLPAEHAAKVRRERLSRDGDDNVVWTYVKRGLPEIVCFCLPETAFVKENEPVGDTYDKTIAVYFLDHVAVSDGLKRRLRQAINSWLDLQYQEDMNRDDIRRVGQSVMDDENWEMNMQVHPEMDASGECVNVNSQYYNALIARAASGLAGRPVRFQDGLTKYLVRKTPAGNIYNGIELVLFRPLGLLRGDNQYYFSEVVTLTTATFPGRQDQGVYVAARIRMRNWGPVDPMYDSGKNRSFDVFMPAIQHEVNNYGHFQHSTLMGQVERERPRGTQRPGINGTQERPLKWARKNDVRLYDLLSSLSDNGNDEFKDANLMLPRVNGQGHGSWWLPRLSSVHGDRFLNGGTGVPTPDRRYIIQALDEVLAGELGLIKEQPLRRLHRLPAKTKNPRPWGPFENKADQVTCLARRAHISKALKQNGPDDLLNILVLAMNEDTVEHIKGSLEKDFYHGCDFEERAHEINGGAHVRELSARPAGGAGGVRLISTMASPFSELMEPIQVKGTNEDKQKAMRKTTTARLSHYLRLIREQLSIHGIGVAIFEMPDNFMGKSTDPFWAAKQALAENRFLPQGLLREKNMEGKGKAATHQEKCKAAFLDCLRMLGVSPLFVRPDEKAIDDYPMPAAICNLRINNSKVLPAAIRLNVETGEIECCLCESNGGRGWEPYASAVLRLYKRVFDPIKTGDASSKRVVRLFLTEVIEQLIRDNENLPKGGVIFVNPVNFRDDDIRGFHNKDMQLDRITVGAKTFTPRDFGKTALVRIKPDGEKTPSYLMMPDKKGNTSAWASGLFRWDDGVERTVFSLKPKSNTETAAARYNNDSRNKHPTFVVEKRERRRSTAGLCEMTLALSPENCLDDVIARERIFYYCKRLCELHNQYRYYTQLPFPLHELKLLGDCIQS